MRTYCVRASLLAPTFTPSLLPVLPPSLCAHRFLWFTSSSSVPGCLLILCQSACLAPSGEVGVDCTFLQELKYPWHLTCSRGAGRPREKQPLSPQRSVLGQGLGPRVAAPGPAGWQVLRLTRGRGEKEMAATGFVRSPRPSGALVASQL